MQTDMRALARLGAQLRIAELFAEIEALIDAFPGIGKTPFQVTAPGKRQERARGKRRRVSEATKAKLRASWASRRSSIPSKTVSGPASEPNPPVTRRVLSASARARIVAAQKKRWAAFRKNNKKR